VLQLQYLTNY